MKEEQALAIMFQRGRELLALSKAFEENDNPPAKSWMAECMAAALILMRQARTRQQRLDAITVLTIAIWQAGYEAAPKLEFVLPERSAGMIRWSWVLLAIVVSFAAGMWTMAMMADAKARDKGREDTRHCLNCDHYAYYDAPLCGLRESEGWLWEMNPKDWSCSEWELRRD